MKTKYYHFIIIITTISLLMMSCKKEFLEITPKGSLIASKVSDYNLLLNNPDFYQQTNGGGFQLMALLGDDVAAEEQSFSTARPEAQRAFRYEDEIYLPGTITRDLGINLPLLYALNKTINEVSRAEGDAATKAQLIAEAKAMRAFTYFTFVNYYTKPYNAQTAATDPGFPIVTKADALENIFSRNTVKENYDMMVSDLTAAISDLPIKAVAQTRFSKSAAKAFLAKVYVFMGRYADALTLLNEAFTEINGSGVKLYDYNVEFAAGGSFLPITPQGPNSSGNKINDFTESVLARTYYVGSFNGNGFGNNSLVLSEKAAALYDINDHRLKLYSATYTSTQPNPYGRRRKYGLQYARYGVELSDMYLLRAECKARLNDLAGAKIDVEALRVKRMPAGSSAVPTTISSDQQALIRFIIDERMREYAFTGFRWLDMRRLSVDPLFSSTTYTHTVYLVAGAPTAITMYNLRPARLTQRIPQYIMAFNPEMQNNP